jgi:dihydropyrimidinase
MRRERKMTTRYGILIQGGLVVTGSGIRRVDLGIRGEQIVSVEPKLSEAEAGRVIDASGEYVFPGIIDAHTHPVYGDDLGGLALTAAYGRTTSIILFAYAKPEMKLIDTIKKFKDEGAQKSYVDRQVPRKPRP